MQEYLLQMQKSNSTPARSKDPVAIKVGKRIAQARKMAGFKGTSNNPSFRIVPTRVFVKDQSEGIKRSI